MQIISIQNPSAVSSAAAILATGGVILYPTDTLYGLGVDALSDEAVAKVYAIKGRNEHKQLSCIVADLAMVERYAEVNDLVHTLAEKFLPGPLTLILKKKQGIDTGIARDRDTIGIRIPDNAFCLALARAYDKPITTTSANRSGEKSELSIENILAQFGPAIAQIDLVIDGGESIKSKPSTIVDVSSGKMVILREGAISSAALQNTTIMTY